MMLVLTFFLNAVLNFATGLAVAAVLGPQEFGQFAVASMIAIVLSTSLFDWLRLSATRQYNERVREAHPEVRSSLDLIYLLGGLLLVLGALIVIAFQLTPWLPAFVIIAIAGMSFANGQFEYWSALARARFLNKAYIQLVICKNILALVLMVAAGSMFHDTAWVLAALTLSIAITIVSVWSRLRDPNSRLRLARKERIISFGKYGIPIVIANVLYQLIVLANRWAVAKNMGYADAGQLSLATDITIRIFLSLGAGFDVLLFQNAVRLEATHGLSRAKAQIAKNILLIEAALIPIACGYAMILPFFETLAVPLAYHGAFSKISLVLIPGVLSFCLGQFAFSPVLQLAHRTVPLIWAGAIGLGVDFILLALLPRESEPLTYAFVHSISLVISSMIIAFYTFQLRDCLPPFRDLGAILIATSIMALAIWPLRTVAWPWLALSSSIIIGAIVYALAILTLNVADLRNTLASQMKTFGKFAR